MRSKRLSKGGRRQLRNRIEHTRCGIADIPRVQGAGLDSPRCSHHATSEYDMAEDRIGKERIKRRLCGWRTFPPSRATRIAGGSDFPVESANPFFLACMRRSPARIMRIGPKGWHP